MNNIVTVESLHDPHPHGIATDATQIPRSAPVVVDRRFLFNSSVSLNQDAGCFD